ncbi:pyrimidine monooxygenase [Shigella dysenteriae]|nr:pyrimidine monooxygenase [Shigella boydii]EGI99136.1 luciferase family domain protein [Shigella boydii 3594-74]EIQ25210.1 pyrimidine monooxygenase RutA domain protein [Shigella flexneri K-315]EIQ58791.1 pyrimidine monooxygenase RutA domain protein [Shigella dysenteriae 225-75]MKQ11258.1 pyrimidine monooxygenase [Shigella dysenteriae]ODG77716.1 pyrimidine monooxygenase [Shigella sp. FC1882]ODG89286.1 pyrimidine monooxygenase [Shigella sp. FC1764]ODJ34302.1 pyrimidine monooxygenase [Shigell
MMKIGVFVPIGNNGWLISTHAPQYMPTFELNKAIVQKAEHYHFDFALLKWHTEFGHLNRGDMLTSEQHRCSNEKKKF